MAQQMAEALIRRREVERRVGLSRSALYRRIAEGTFPRPVPIGPGRAVGWLESEVTAFVSACIAQRDQRAA